MSLRFNPMSSPIVFLCSGGGGNLRFVYQAIKRGWLKTSSLVVVADRPCPAIDFAKQFGLENYIVDFQTSGQSELIATVSLLNPMMIITTVHRILSSHFLEKFDGRMINLHYSNLPAYAGTIGTRPVQDALSYGNRLIGVTVHEVTETLDGGKPLVQVALPVMIDDETDEVMNFVFRAGCFALLTAIFSHQKSSLLIEDAACINISSRPVLINPAINYPLELFDELFWGLLKS